MAGNHYQDGKEAKRIRETILYPFLLENGFVKFGTESFDGLIKRIPGRSTIWVHRVSRVIIAIYSSPSGSKDIPAIRQTISDVRFNVEERFGDDMLDDFKVYLHFTRPYSEWKDKKTYIRTLERLEGIMHVQGRVTVGHSEETLRYCIERWLGRKDASLYGE